MPAPTLEQVNLVNAAIQSAAEAQTALMDLQNYLMQLQFSNDLATAIASADFTDPATPRPLAGFDPAKFVAFNTAASAVLTLVASNNNAIGIAFAALARRKPLK